MISDGSTREKTRYRIRNDAALMVLNPLADMRAAVCAATQTAKVSGLRNIGSLMAAGIVAEVFFPNRSEATRDEIRNDIYDVICVVSDLIEAAQPNGMRDALKRVLNELTFLATAFDSDRRPRRTDKVGRDALMVMTGRLPPSLDPGPWGTPSNFGRLQIGPLSNVIAGVPIPQPSLLLQALVHFAASHEELTAITTRSLTKWPRCLAELGVDKNTKHDDIVDIYWPEIRRLHQEQRRELVELAIAGRKWLKWCFGIRKRNDPLNFSNVRLVAPSATAKILASLTEVICPWPRIMPTHDILRALREPLHDQETCHPDLQDSLYQSVFDITRRNAKQLHDRDGALFKKKAQLIGLLDPLRKADAFDRYVENYVRMLRAIRMINASRIYIDRKLESKGLSTADFGKCIGGNNGVCAEDYHELGRWSDDLKGRLEIGYVDRGHDADLRFGLPEPKWKFPSKLREKATRKEFTAALVNAARKANGQPLMPDEVFTNAVVGVCDCNACKRAQ